MKSIFFYTIVALMPILLFVAFSFGKRVERHRTLAEFLYYDWIVFHNKSGLDASNEAVVLQSILMEIDSTPLWLKRIVKPKFSLAQNELRSMAEMIHGKFEIANGESVFPKLRSSEGISEVLRDSYVSRRK